MGIATPVHPSGRPLSAPAAGAGALVVLGVLLGAGVAAALQRTSLSLALVIAAAVALLMALALALARYDAAVAVGFVLLAIVKFEPAPPDGLFAVIIAVALVTGRFDASRVPLAVLALMGSFLLFNVVSAVDALDPMRAALFFSITLYLCVFAVWFGGYLELDATNAPRRRRLCRGGGRIGAGEHGVAHDRPGERDPHGLRRDARLRALQGSERLGAFLIPAALIVLEESLRPRLLRRRPLLNRVLFMLLVLGVLFSYSRGAWLDPVVATVVMLVVMALRRRSGRGALGLLVVIVLAASAVTATVVFTDAAPFL